MNKKRVLTGVTTTGIPHLGNYVGAIRPAIAASHAPDTESFLFLADYHGIIKCHDPELIHESTQAVAATWLACGLDPEKTTFYRQSDIPEIMELNWILTCITAKGLMNRAHAYKAAVQENLAKRIQRTFGINGSYQEYEWADLRLSQEIQNLFNYQTDSIISNSYKLLWDFLADIDEYLPSGIITIPILEDFEKEFVEIPFDDSGAYQIRNKSVDELRNFFKKYGYLLDLNDDGIEMGLYSYPILMTADILMFNAQEVPVGRDQIQHVEMARDIAGRFNHRFKEVFTLPEVKIDENVELLVGLDGRKMSKSYGNTIPLWENDKKTQKSVNKIITNLKEPGEPKQPDESPLFEIYKAFATPAETAEFTQMLAEGLAWGEAKKMLAAKINAELAEPRERYSALTANPAQIEDILQAGAQKARKQARVLLDQVRDAVGIRALK